MHKSDFHNHHADWNKNAAALWVLKRSDTKIPTAGVAPF